MKLKKWFYNKNFSEVEMYLIETSECEEVISETDMAIMIRWTTKYGEIIKWVPKSCIAMEDELDAKAREYMEIRFSGDFRCPYCGYPLRLEWLTIEGKVIARPCDISDDDCEFTEMDRDYAAEWCSDFCGFAKTLDEANEIARMYETFFH